ncbi:helix-turn-helix domain-containing protein [Sorangium sp. KYC3313]|uniref:helix-turn-helix domain-containing protein n=1 Tax=Sorangium sp. KYC3313 TaxID=3449740 RepID=UPI003F8BD9DA
MQTVAQVQTAEPWVSVEEVALHLGVARDSVYRWIDAKGLPAHRIGKLWKFKLSEVDDWVRAEGANEAQARAKPVCRNSTRKKK